jgi:hypothetical protein
MITNNKCEVNCNGHIGNVVMVNVYGQGWKPLRFHYCQAAIEEDKRRGFDVVEVKDGDEQLLNSGQNVQVSDTTKDDSSN